MQLELFRYIKPIKRNSARLVALQHIWVFSRLLAGANPWWNGMSRTTDVSNFTAFVNGEFPLVEFLALVHAVTKFHAVNHFPTFFGTLDVDVVAITVG